MPTKRYIAIGTLPRVIPVGRIVVHNHVRPVGSPNTPVGYEAFRAWTDVPRPTAYRVTRCRCGWAPHLREHFRVDRAAPAAT